MFILGAFDELDVTLFIDPEVDTAWYNFPFQDMLSAFFGGVALVDPVDVTSGAFKNSNNSASLSLLFGRIDLGGE